MQNFFFKCHRNSKFKCLAADQFIGNKIHQVKKKKTFVELLFESTQDI